jgi:hypothetical protein
MKTEVKAKWVEALRSGEYKQGKDRLRCEDTYCCLGVLADLAVREGIGAWEGNLFVAAADPFDVGGALTPEAVVEWAGLPDTNPVVGADGQRHTLSGLNDNSRTFDEIANLIEAQL